MKKNFLYLILVIVLASITYFFVFKEDENAFDTSEANFTVKDTSKIQKIFLSNLRNENIKLTRDGVSWKLNDSLEPNPDVLNLLLTALHKQIPEQPVPVNYHDFALKSLSARSTKVELYDKHEKTHTFYVGEDPAENNLTYMLTEGAKRPFIVVFPFEKNFVGIRYTTRINDWRSKHILHHNSNIELVDVSYKDSTQYSFKIEQNDHKIHVNGTYLIPAALNEKRVRSYLNLLNEVYCTGFENLNFLKEATLKNGIQLATITIKRQGFKADVLTLYFRETDKGTKKVINIGGKEFDHDYYFGWLNNRDFINISRQSLEKMLRSYPEFYQTDSL